MSISYKINIYMPYCPAVPLPDIYPKKLADVQLELVRIFKLTLFKLAKT